MIHENIEQQTVEVRQRFYKEQILYRKHDVPGHSVLLSHELPGLLAIRVKIGLVDFIAEENKLNQKFSKMVGNLHHFFR